MKNLVDKLLWIKKIHTNIFITALLMLSLLHAVEVELTELEIKDELYTGSVLTEKESSKYSFIGAREDKDAIIIVAQKRNPYSLHGHNFVQCVVHTNKDKFCYYLDYIAGKQHPILFRLNDPHPKAFALMVLYISISTKRSDQITKRFPKLSPETEYCS